MSTIVTKKLTLFTLVCMFVFALLVTSPVSAQDDTPTQPSDEDSTKKGEVIIIKTIGSGFSAPLAPSATLSSILSWTIGMTGTEDVTGKAKVTVSGSPLPLAKAWTTLLKNGVQLETTLTTYPCWTSSSNPCTSSTNHYLGNHAYWQNIAETDVFWASGGSSHSSAVASKQF